MTAGWYHTMNLSPCIAANMLTLSFQHMLVTIEPASDRRKDRGSGERRGEGQGRGGGRVRGEEGGGSGGRRRGEGQGREGEKGPTREMSLHLPKLKTLKRVGPWIEVRKRSLFLSRMASSRSWVGPD